MCCYFPFLSAVLSTPNLCIAGGLSPKRCALWNVEGLFRHHVTPPVKCQKRDPWWDSLWQTERQGRVCLSLYPPWRQRQVDFSWRNVDPKETAFMSFSVKLHLTKQSGFSQGKEGGSLDLRTLLQLCPPPPPPLTWTWSPQISTLRHIWTICSLIMDLWQSWRTTSSRLVTT